MKLAWIKYAGGMETRDDGYTIYHDPRYALLRYPDGGLEKFSNSTEAKKVADSNAIFFQLPEYPHELIDEMEK